MARGDLGAVAEFMRNVRQCPRWDAAWLAVERMFVKVRDVRQSRAIGRIANEFMPMDTPARISVMIAEGEVWMARRLGDKGGYALARQRLEFWRTRGTQKPGEPPKTRTEPDAPERVLADYPRLAEEAGLVIGFTRPAAAIVNALPLHGLKAVLARIVDLYSVDGRSRSCALVTLRAVRTVLRSMPALVAKPSQPSTGP